MNPKDKKILNALQENFPLDERPYQKISDRIGISEKEIILRAGKMMKKGVIRRFGIIINHKKLAYFSTLLGVKLKNDALPAIVDFVKRRPEVTHCYQRRGEYNLWFTFLTPKKEIFNRFLSHLKKKVRAENILNLPTVRSFKLKTTFNV